MTRANAALAHQIMGRNLAMIHNATASRPTYLGQHSHTAPNLASMHLHVRQIKPGLCIMLSLIHI